MPLKGVGGKVHHRLPDDSKGIRMQMNQFESTEIYPVVKLNWVCVCVCHVPCRPLHDSFSSVSEKEMWA